MDLLELPSCVPALSRGVTPVDLSLRRLRLAIPARPPPLSADGLTRAAAERQQHARPAQLGAIM